MDRIENGKIKGDIQIVRQDRQQGDLISLLQILAFFVILEK
jgi:hypothetical protein